MNNGLFLPLEVVKREYLGKLCLAVEMAARGMPVFIGHKKWIIQLALEAPEPGIFFYKDAALGEWFVPKLMEKGFGLVAQDEEAGIIYANYEQFYIRRSSLDNIPNLHRFFSWGEEDYSFLRNRFCEPDRCNIVNTGAVKTVFWGPIGRQYFRNEIRTIKEQYGRYVIFVSNFSVGNSYLSEEDIFQPRQKKHDKAKAQYHERHEKDGRLMRLAAMAAGRIAAQIGFNVIIRPHPVENVKRWTDATRSLDNVYVEPDGDLTPWILASECVLHNSCTSGLQAAASDIPAVAFGESDLDLGGVRSVPNDVSLPAIGLSGILETVNDVNERWQSTDTSRRSLLERKLTGVGSLEALMNNADTLLELGGRPNDNGNRHLGGDSVLYDLKEFCRTSKYRAQTRNRIRDQNKRPTIKKREIEKDVTNLSKLLGHGNNVSVDRVGRNSYCVRRVFKKTPYVMKNGD